MATFSNKTMSRCEKKRAATGEAVTLPEDKRPKVAAPVTVCAVPIHATVVDSVLNWSKGKAVTIDTAETAVAAGAGAGAGAEEGEAKANDLHVAWPSLEDAVPAALNVAMCSAAMKRPLIIQLMNSTLSAVANGEKVCVLTTPALLLKNMLDHAGADEDCTEQERQQTVIAIAAMCGALASVQVCAALNWALTEDERAHGMAPVLQPLSHGPAMPDSSTDQTVMLLEVLRQWDGAGHFGYALNEYLYRERKPLESLRPSKGPSARHASYVSSKAGKRLEWPASAASATGSPIVLTCSFDTS